MNTLNEIRFDDKDLFFNDNVVKTSILPQGTKDLKRNIKVQANSVFEGSVFGNNVEIEDGGVIFKGAVFANTELHVGTDVSGTVKFNKAVAGAQSIAALVVKGRVLFCSDVNAPTVRLKNCYIGGSVFGNEEDYVGGLVGYNDADGTIDVDYTLIGGSVFASGDCAGGLAGLNASS